MSRPNSESIFLGVLLAVWVSQIIYLWPAPPYVANESVELLGGMSTLWKFYLEWLGLVVFGFGGALALYKRYRFWPVVVILSSALYLWTIQFPDYVATFFVGMESLQQIPSRFQLLGQGLSDVTLLHMQFISPVFFVFAAGYAVVSYVRSRKSHIANVAQSGI